MKIVKFIKKHTFLVIILAFALIGVVALYVTQAATNSVAIEAELGSVVSPAASYGNSSTASGSSAVKFNAGSTTPPGQSFTIIAAGDVGKGYSDKKNTISTAQLIKDINPAYVLALGDLAYESGTYSEFKSNYHPYWGVPEILNKTKPVNGNHEYNTSGATGYFQYFEEFGIQTGSRDKGYYSFTHNNWLFLMLNSECGKVSGGCGASSAQAAFVTSELAANPTKCVIAGWHRPRFNGGPSDTRPSSVHGDESAVDPLWDKIVARKGIVVQGHNHFYNRMHPMNGDGVIDNTNGIVSFVSGLGGANPYSISYDDPEVAAKSNVTGLLKMTLSGNKADFQYINASTRAVIDSGTITAGCPAP